MESEAREILARGCLEDESHSETLGATLDLPHWVDRLFGPDKPADVVDSLIAQRQREAARE